MEVEFIEKIAKIRIAVGYLGERGQYSWWQSSFFTQGCDAFLSPLFARTQILAQCEGVTHAAALVHDERIGVGHVYHLFRLPEEMERAIHQSLHRPGLDLSLQKIIMNPKTALEYLRNFAGTIQPGEVGPVYVGNIVSLHNLETWKLVSGAYVYGFDQKTIVCPYFTDLL